MVFGLVNDEIARVCDGKRHHAELIVEPSKNLSVGDKVTFQEVPDANSPYAALDSMVGGKSVTVVLSLVRAIDGPGDLTGVVHVEWSAPMAARWLS